jgi:hypothetical protein
VDRPIERRLQPRPGCDLVEPPPRLRQGQSRQDAEQERVLAPGQEGLEADLGGQERPDAAAHPNRALVRRDHAGEDPQQRRLAGSRRSDKRHALAGLDPQVDVAKPPGGIADPTDPREGRGQDTASPIEVEPNAETIRDHLGRRRRGLDRPRDGEAHQPTSFASAPCSLR